MIFKVFVDEYLLSAYQPGMTDQALFESYVTFGEDPFIIVTPSKEAGVPVLGVGLRKR